MTTYDVSVTTIHKIEADSEEQAIARLRSYHKLRAENAYGWNNDIPYPAEYQETVTTAKENWI